MAQLPPEPHPALEKIGFEPGNVRVLVTVNLSVEVGPWSPDNCDVGKISAQARDEAMERVQQLVSKAPGVYVSGGTMTRVVVDSKQKP